MVSACSLSSRTRFAAFSIAACASSDLKNLFSTRISGWPATTVSPSLTRISAMMPPSRCCTSCLVCWVTIRPDPRVTLSIWTTADQISASKRAHADNHDKSSLGFGRYPIDATRKYIGCSAPEMLAAGRVAQVRGRRFMTVERSVSDWCGVDAMP